MANNSKRLIVIDSLNIFLRGYIVDPSLSPNGDNIGGLLGSLKSLQKFLREIKPSKIVIAWDGVGGSKRRKQLDKNYKYGRAPTRVNWNVGNMSSAEQLENEVWQITQLKKYYEKLPVYQFIFDGVEADDIISYVVQLEMFQDYEKCILSSDKDFIQLLNSKTILHRPVQKETLNTKRVIEKYGVHPNNFLLARSIAGDSSDNLVGVDGIGLKTLAKRFPFLSESKQYLLEDIIANCKETKNKLKVHFGILENQDKIKHNYSVMQLTVPQFSFQDKQTIKTTLETQKLKFQKTELMKEMVQDGCTGWNFDELYCYCNKIVVDSKL